jgi:hypothetical protein
VAAGRARGSRPRRVSLPGIAELLRPVGPGLASDCGRQASGRESHPLKITVYLSSDEFLDLERARLTLRTHGIGADRGRLVREAIALLMTDLEAGIDASVIAKRLRAADRDDPADDAPLTNGAPAHGAPANGGLADGARVNGGVAEVARVNGWPAEVARVDGGPADGVMASGSPVAGVLATGARLTGPPEGPQ